jgi:hypothetical protein
VNLAQQNAFDPTILQNMLSLLIGTAKRTRYVPEKSVINMILLFPVFDWRIIMIGPGGLLLVVSHLFADSVFV